MDNQKLSLPALLLLRFCRAVGTRDYPMSGIHYESGKELDLLDEVFPNIRRDLAGKIVIDFGCGIGYQSTAFALAGARQVIGVDIAEEALERARQRATDLGVTDRVGFTPKIPDGLKADVIVSQNSFEHLIGAAEVLAELRAALAPGGKIFVTFAPPWYAPWGAHMAYFCRLPWVQLFFPERTVMEVRSLFRTDGKRTYHDAGLGQISLAKFERLVKECRLQRIFKRYDCSRGLNWLRHSPLRELFVNRISCILIPQQEGTVTQSRTEPFCIHEGLGRAQQNKLILENSLAFTQTNTRDRQEDARRRALSSVAAPGACSRSRSPGWLAFLLELVKNSLLSEWELPPGAVIPGRIPRMKTERP